MKIEYDKNADAAYIYLISEEEIKTEWVKKTYSCDPIEVYGMINLDFDSNGFLGGIEVMDASKKLSKELLNSAIQIG